MQLLCLASQSFRAVLAFRLRTFFSLVSVALGVGSLTIIVAATEGAYQKAFEIVGRFGPDALLVIGGSEETRAIGQREKVFTIDDVQAVMENFPAAYLGEPLTSEGDVNVSYRERRAQTLVVGAESDYCRAWSWRVVKGSDLTKAHVKGAENVALIGGYLARELFGEEEPVGKHILVKGIPVKIVGELEERGATVRGSNLDDRLVMPITTVMRKIKNERVYINAFRIRFLDQERLGEHVEELRRFLRARHGTPVGRPDDFQIISPTEIVKFLVALTGSLVIFLGITGVVSMAVAGFVLANLSLLSVSERAREVGIRRAVGAKRREILQQFLGEAVLLTIGGGVLGFVFAVLASHALSAVFEFPVHFSWKAFVIGMGIATFVGLVFGLLPARKAADLNPIEAIRS